ncbi:glycoside hydrolase family 15 protein [Acidisoma cellulosilytica]|uniref:Glycoside hydrolase family 15 protein n=1 Tax=Acidisoma cellulosilyticum TaxID=2802395 RepID=A0A964E6S7_9PROT|nr:glycoside hydrolase family 15 protein [Acidisoma cellulosilyticum]MCB8883889.1 glycoside hydrolase family 15 protein [Acidisoma cellulosilyticum]
MVEPIRAFADIGDHGVIGDRATIALVSHDAAIDFLCWPEFDSPTIFAQLLDPDCGVFSLQPDLTDARRIQAYVPDTNILVTRWLCNEGSAEVLDLLVPKDGPYGGPTRLIRRATATRGSVTFRLLCRPRPDYGRETPTAEANQDSVTFRSAAVENLVLSGHEALKAGDGDATATFTLETGQSALFLLSSRDEGEIVEPAMLEDMIARSTMFWQHWSSQSTYRGRWRETVMRSALVLKLLTSRHHHSIIAAPTFGLPEAGGGTRNWDYRATWIRDASFTVYAFIRLGYVEEASNFMNWVEARVADRSTDGSIQVMYRFDGSKDFPEVELDHMQGYYGARPVRIGNAATDQQQLDIYGELMDSLYLKNKYGRGISWESWGNVTHMIDYVVDHWREADHGIWEFRGEPRHFLHSRLMCWVAVDRAIRLATKRSLPAPFERWTNARNKIYESIHVDFWNADCGHFTQCTDNTVVDGAMLLMPLVRFIGATDPRWSATLDQITERLTDDGMVWRYHEEDGLPGQEGSFTACSFWYVECLARAGRLEEARMKFERILSYGNHLGLFAEELSPRGEALGNFPQGLSHLALISAAFYLDRALSTGKDGEWRA